MNEWLIVENAGMSLLTLNYWIYRRLIFTAAFLSGPQSNTMVFNNFYMKRQKILSRLIMIIIILWLISVDYLICAKHYSKSFYMYQNKIIVATP